MAEQRQYEVPVDAAVSRRLLASQLAHDGHGRWVALAGLLSWVTWRSRSLRFDAQGFELLDSRGSSGRTPWTVVTAVDHEPGSGTVTWRAADGVGWTVPEEIFPERERALWRDR